MFIRGADDALWHRWLDRGWHDWKSLGGILTSGPAAVSGIWENNFGIYRRIDVFVRGADNALWHKWFDGSWHDGSWHDWKSLGGILTSDPAVASWGMNRLDVFVRGGENALWHKWFDGSWHDWELLGGVLTSGPAAVSWSRSRLDVFVRGGENALWHKWFDGSWHDWELLGGVLTSGPAVSSWGSSRLDVFVRGGENALWHKWFDGSWHDWELLGGVLTSGPAAVSWGNNRIDVFAGIADNILDRKLWNKSGWHGWEEWPYPASQERPIPNGFIRLNLSSGSEDFEHWGKYHTKYGSINGSPGWLGTSQRWDNSKMEALNMVAGFQFKIGPDAAPIWKHEREEPSPTEPPDPLQPQGTIIYGDRDPPTLLYIPRAIQVGHFSRNGVDWPIYHRGSYILGIKSFVGEPVDPRDHRIPPSEASANKEYPHPDYGNNPPFNKDKLNPAPKIGNVRDGKWHGILAAVYNDRQTGWPVIKLWYNPRATHNMTDYIYLGCSTDSPEIPMNPGPPLTHDVVGIDNLLKVEHPLRIRIDNIPKDQLEIRDMYAVAVSPRYIPPHDDTGGGTTH